MPHMQPLAFEAVPEDIQEQLPAGVAEATLGDSFGWEVGKHAG